MENLKSIATRLRIHSLRSTAKAGSGHPSSCLSAADLMAALFFHAMRFDPARPDDPACDRFVLSKGHAAPLLWGAWAEAGAIPREKLLTLRELDSELEGHPTPRFPWVDVATGSLGQGLSVGVGQALSFKNLDKNDARVFVLLGDGECAEGAVWEAASIAAHFHLNNLIAVVDINKWGQSQETMYEHHAEIYAKKFEACGWRTLAIDGHDMKAIVAALDSACAEASRPTVILAKTIKGKGVPLFEDKTGWHGKPLSVEDAEKAIVEMEKEAGPAASCVSTCSTHPPAGPFRMSRPHEASPAFSFSISSIASPSYKIGESIATRAAYGEALVKLGKILPQVVALDGDTKNSTYSEKFLKAFPERFFECFIAEQNMIGMALGLAARGKIPFASTFGAFMSRAFDQIRMAGISQKPIKLCGSHAGVSIGEDGPSQMALEDLAMMRAIPGIAVLYPSDAVSCERLVALAAAYPGMSYLRTARPATPVLYSNDAVFKIGGSQILRSSAKDKATLVAAGITVYEALKAHDLLQKEGIAVRVIDCYSIKPIDEKTLTEAARQTGLILTIEDHYPEGGLGDAVLSALGPHGFKVKKLAVNQLPRSGKPAELLKLCGISAEAIVQKVKGEE